jgi:hypothetical protein
MFEATDNQSCQPIIETSATNRATSLGTPLGGLLFSPINKYPP